jgi:hypothetical protein
MLPRWPTKNVAPFKRSQTGKASAVPEENVKKEI